MRPLTIYLDSSVIGGYFDPEWQEATRELWRQWEAGRFRFRSSSVCAAEMLRAPEHVRQLFIKTFPAAGLLPADEEVERLAAAYLNAAVVPRRYSDDARHVAAATVAGCLVLVSWNFRHLANVVREAGFNSVNLLQGYPPVRIVSPLELIYEDAE